jgi:membrane-associated phospholipid phosphatase
VSRLERVLRFRCSERLAVAYFVYVALIAPFYIARPWRTSILAVAVTAGLWLMSRWTPIARDFAPLGATLAAYREMDWFASAPHDHHLERAWVAWDRILLDGYHLRAAIESTGAILPGFLELCYLLVYAVGPAVVVAAIVHRRRDSTDHLWMAYLAGTLGAYALFPYFPSDPPRTVFPTADLPHVITALRRLNLYIVGGYGIHSSVFPSAHVSSAFSAAWGLLKTIPEKRWIGWSMAAYAVLVSIATVYGRYHYGVDVLAGFAVSLLAIPAERIGKERK